MNGDFRVRDGELISAEAWNEFVLRVTALQQRIAELEERRNAEDVVIAVARQEIQSRLDAAFATPRRFNINGALLEVAARQKQLILVEGSDRLGIKFTIDSTLFPPRGPVMTISGTVTVSSVSVYQAEQKALHLGPPRFDAFEMPEELWPFAPPLIKQTISDELPQVAIYELTPAEAQKIRAGFILRDARVRNGALQAIFGRPR